ncbi:uncharacterized protein BJX67DRAFT_383064 [Aspergillus lucknowensis]|uniref:Uncharacterized protein n=1 Tax=Aspergillus lucknowensis TaxID=176173 RepID=A0ABR4LLS9_9EURO
MKSFMPVVLALMGFAAQGYALSCQDQGGSCYDGDRDCPAGTDSVLWDDGCASGFWWWEEDDKCCV